MIKMITYLCICGNKREHNIKNKYFLDTPGGRGGLCTKVAVIFFRKSVRKSNKAFHIPETYGITVYSSEIV